MTLLQIDLTKLNAPDFSAACRSGSHALRLLYDASVTETKQMQAVIETRRGLVAQLRRGGGTFGPVAVSSELIAAIDDAIAEKSQLMTGLAAELEAATGTLGLCIPLVLSAVVDPQKN
jgi:hypothetical protein